MLERYRIERELGRGGMGVVYVATDENTGRLVALKTTSVAQLGSGEKSRNQRRERFIREVRALTQVNHENVVHVFDAGECDDANLGWLLFYTMEYVEGTTLASLVQERGALSAGEAAAVVMQVAAGLGEAHAQGIIHRDVKPANIFLSVDGRAKIGDFGIAKIEGSTQITRRDQLVGTPNYLAPEQILGDPVGPQTDVFALGALFFVITQNKPLRQQVDAAALLASANGNDPVARMMAVGNLPDGLKRVVARSLERDPARRYIDGAAFADALAEHATRVPALPGSAPARPEGEFLAEGTSDRSSAFLSTAAKTDEAADVPEAEEDDIESIPDDLSSGGASGIEALAAAMLGEVERRSTGTFKGPVNEPLPVARTESTVMFNLRAMEEEHQERSGRMAAAPTTSTSNASSNAANASLPVARSEPTSMFALSELEKISQSKPMPRAPGPSSSSSSVSPPTNMIAAPPSSSSPSVSPPTNMITAPVPPTPARPRIELEPVRDDGSSWNDEATRESEHLQPPSSATPPSSMSSMSSMSSLSSSSLDGPTLDGGEDAPPTATRVPRTGPRTVRLTLPPRPLLLAATLAIGLLLGIALAAALKPQPKKATPLVDIDIAPLSLRPAMCAEAEVAPQAQAQAAQLLDEARALKRDGASATKVVETLNRAIAFDPANAILFYELGRQVSGKEQDDADECVCQLAPASKECGIVEKARR